METSLNVKILFLRGEQKIVLSPDHSYELIPYGDYFCARILDF